MVIHRAVSPRTWLVGVFALIVSLFAVAVQAQTGAAPAARAVTSGTPDASRAELTHLLDSLQKVPASQGSTAQRRDRNGEIETLRTRLAAGDFQVGDRILVDDGQRRDTVIVRDSVRISLLNWPDYSLHGVLRSEIQPALEKYVGTYVREPRIRVFPLARLSFTGGFQRQGYLIVDPERPLTDAINTAGGVPQNGKLDKITVYRGTKRLLNEKKVSEAIRDGATLDDLGLQSGDEVRAPQVKTRNFNMPSYQILLFSISAFGALLALIRASYVP